MYFFSITLFQFIFFVVIASDSRSQEICRCMAPTSDEATPGEGAPGQRAYPSKGETDYPSERKVCLYHAPAENQTEGHWLLIPEKASQTHLGVHPGDYIDDIENCRKNGATQAQGENSNSFENGNAGVTEEEAVERMGDFADGELVRGNQKVGRDENGNNTDDPTIGQSRVGIP